MVNDKSIDDVIKSYGFKFIPVSLQEEHALIKMAQSGNRMAMSRLVKNNGLFAIKVAIKFRKYNVPFEHIAQCALIGLHGAIMSFDTTRGLRLISHAVWLIRAYVKREIHDTDTIIRIPANWHWEKEMRPLHESIRCAMSLDSPLRNKDKECSLHDVLPSYSCDPCEDADSETIMAEIFSEARLSARELEIVMDNYGVMDGSKISLSDIGRERGISQERVRQIRDVAIDKCKARIKIRTLEKLGVDNICRNKKLKPSMA